MLHFSTSMQTGLAVGDIQKERERAELTRLKLWVSSGDYDQLDCCVKRGVV